MANLLVHIWNLQIPSPIRILPCMPMMSSPVSTSSSTTTMQWAQSNLSLVNSSSYSVDSSLGPISALPIGNPPNILQNCWLQHFSIMPPSKKNTNSTLTKLVKLQKMTVHTGNWRLRPLHSSLTWWIHETHPAPPLCWQWCQQRSQLHLLHTTNYCFQHWSNLHSSSQVRSVQTTGPCLIQQTQGNGHPLLLVYDQENCQHSAHGHWDPSKTCWRSLNRLFPLSGRHIGWLSFFRTSSLLLKNWDTLPPQQSACDSSYQTAVNGRGFQSICKL